MVTLYKFFGEYIAYLSILYSVFEEYNRMHVNALSPKFYNRKLTGNMLSIFQNCVSIDNIKCRFIEDASSRIFLHTYKHLNMKYFSRKAAKIAGR